MDSISSARQLHIPNLFGPYFPKIATNPHYVGAAAESRAWIHSYNVLSDKKQTDFIQSQHELLCSYAYPHAGYEQLRMTCDLVNLLYVIDELSDEQSGAGALTTVRAYVQATKDTDCDDGSTLATITKDFQARFQRLAGPKNVKRFKAFSEAYAASVVSEAALREQQIVLDVKNYTTHRRSNSATPLCFSLIECVLGIDLDDEVYQDETFMEAYWAACDHVCWANDIYSYDCEQSKGHSGNNIVTVLMQENKTSLQETADYIGFKCNELMDTYFAARNRLPAALGPDAVRFIESLSCWVVANLIWSFETERYFGSQRLHVRKTGLLYLRPQMSIDEKCDISDEC